MDTVVSSSAANYSQLSRVGYVKISRTIFSCDLFEEGAPFSKREAFLWLVANAAWKPTAVQIGKEIVTIKRGQLAYSLRFLATSWKWPNHMNVKRFLANLEARTLIVTETVQGLLQVTICNYEEYPSESTEPVTGSVTDFVTNKNTINNTYKTKKEDNQSASGSGSYLYQRGKVRLKAADFRRWEQAFANLNLRAELEALSDWASKQPNWFPALAAALAKRDREAKLRREAEREEREAARKNPVDKQWSRWIP